MKDLEIKVQVIAGSGNNGGGGIVAARRLLAWGIQTEIYLPRGVKNLRQVPDEQIDRYQKIGGKVKDGLPKLSNTNTLLLDCYIGYGYVKRDDEISKKVFDFLKHSPNVISLDVPSGLDVTTGESVSGIKPLATLTIAFIKRGILRIPLVNIGKLYVCDIGVPTKVYRSELGIQWTLPFDITYLKKLEIAFREKSFLEAIVHKKDDPNISFWKIKN